MEGFCYPSVPILNKVEGHNQQKYKGWEEMDKKKLTYLVIGAGGTGGALGSHMAHAGHNVTFIARGKHLEAMRENGLIVSRPDCEFFIAPVNAFTAEECVRRVETARNFGRYVAPDVIFVCVKGYSVDEIIPFISFVAGPDTVVIPILNIFGTGSRIQERIPNVPVTDGCIYVASEIKEPGCIWMNGTILRVVFGLRKEQRWWRHKMGPVLERVRDDLCSSGIDGILSDSIERDCLRKFSYVSPQGACGLYYDVPAGAFQEPGEIRDCFAGLIKEVSDLADAMGIGFGEDIVAANLKIIESLSPDMTTSLQRDVAAGKASEIDGLIYDVVRMGKQYGVSTPLYEKISSELQKKYK